MDREQMIAHLTLHGVRPMINNKFDPLSVRLRRHVANDEPQWAWSMQYEQWEQRLGGLPELYTDVLWERVTDKMLTKLPSNYMDFINLIVK